MVDTAAFERAASDLNHASQKIMEVAERQSSAFYGGAGGAAAAAAAGQPGGGSDAANISLAAQHAAAAYAAQQLGSPQKTVVEEHHHHERRPSSSGRAHGSLSGGHSSVSSVLRAYEEGRKAERDARAGGPSSPGRCA